MIHPLKRDDASIGADCIADGGEGVGREMEEEDAKGMNSFSHNYSQAETRCAITLSDQTFIEGRI